MRHGVPGARPVVVVQTWHNEQARFADLSAALGDTELWSILPPDPPDDEPPRRVEHWVDRAEAVLATLPVEPPVRILGWSFGGVVGLELARRLRDRGVPVAFVGMIDTTRPRLRPVDDAEYVWFHLGAAAAMSERSARLPYLWHRLLFLVWRRFPRTGRLFERTTYRLGLRSRPPRPPLAAPPDPLQAAIHVSYLNYQGAPVPFPVTLFATRPSLARRPEPALRWAGQLHGGFELTVVDGDHEGLFDPEHIRSLATALRRSLDRADEDLGAEGQARATSAS